MFYLLTIVLTIILGFGFDWDGIFLLPLCIGTIISSISQIVHYLAHIEDMEYITKFKKDIDIYKEQANEVLAEIKIYMIDKFPEFEMAIFDKITSQTVDILAVKYPELKSDEVFKKYVDSFISLKKNIYDNKIKITDKERTLNIRKRTIKLFVLPILPKEK